MELKSFRKKYGQPALGVFCVRSWHFSPYYPISLFMQSLECYDTRTNLETWEVK